MTKDRNISDNYAGYFAIFILSTANFDGFNNVILICFLAGGKTTRYLLLTAGRLVTFELCSTALPLTIFQCQLDGGVSLRVGCLENYTVVQISVAKQELFL